MELKNQVCSLEQAKKLKELGIRPLENLCNFFDSSVGMMLLHRITGSEILEQDYPAFTVAELGAMLPDTIPTNSNIRFAELVSRKDCLEWQVGYDVDVPTSGGYGPDVKEIYNGIISNNENEAQSRAAMLIHLLENKLVTAEDCNKRLNA